MTSQKKCSCIKIKKSIFLGHPTEHPDGNIRLWWRSIITGHKVVWMAKTIWQLHCRYGCNRRWPEKVHQIFGKLSSTPRGADVANNIPAETVFTAAKRVLNEHFNTKVNVTFNCHVFQSTKQVKDESVDHFYTRLEELAVCCNFHEKEEEIKSQIILTCKSKKLRADALTNPTWHPTWENSAKFRFMNLSRISIFFAGIAVFDLRNNKQIEINCRKHVSINKIYQILTWRDRSARRAKTGVLGGVVT